MSTLQKAIRDLAVVNLTAQLPGGTNIKRAPRRSLDDSEILPGCVCIFSHGDRPENQDDDQMLPHPRIYTLRVEGIANGRPEEDATDTLATAIRRAFLLDDSFTPAGGTALCSRVVWVGQIWSGDEGDPVQALTALDFDCHYLWRPE
jgi:hypothetical protein